MKQSKLMVLIIVTAMSSQFLWACGKANSDKGPSAIDSMQAAWLTFQAWFYLQGNKQKEGLILARRAVKLDPGSAYSHAMLGGAAAINGQTDLAIEQYKNAIQLDNEDPRR